MLFLIWEYFTWFAECWKLSGSQQVSIKKGPSGVKFSPTPSFCRHITKGVERILYNVRSWKSLNRVFILKEAFNSFTTSQNLSWINWSRKTLCGNECRSKKLRFDLQLRSMAVLLPVFLPPPCDVAGLLAAAMRFTQPNSLQLTALLVKQRDGPAPLVDETNCSKAELHV